MMELSFTRLAEQRKAAAKRYYEKHREKVLAKAKNKYVPKKPRKPVDPNAPILTKKEKRNAYQAKYRDEKIYSSKENRIKHMLFTIKNRALRKGIEFDITYEDLTIPDVCPLLGIKIVWDVPTKGPVHNSPSVDRIDSSKGYIKGNVHVISYRANTLKSNATPEELELLATNLKFFLIKSSS